MSKEMTGPNNAAENLISRDPLQPIKNYLVPVNDKHDLRLEVLKDFAISHMYKGAEYMDKKLRWIYKEANKASGARYMTDEKYKEAYDGVNEITRPLWDSFLEAEDWITPGSLYFRFGKTIQEVIIEKEKLLDPRSETKP
jgi:hypothetical protein